MSAKIRQDRLDARVTEVRRRPENKHCFDCGDKVRSTPLLIPCLVLLIVAWLRSSPMRKVQEHDFFVIVGHSILVPPIYRIPQVLCFNQIYASLSARIAHHSTVI